MAEINILTGNSYPIKPVSIFFHKFIAYVPACAVAQIPPLDYRKPRMPTAKPLEAGHNAAREIGVDCYVAFDQIYGARIRRNPGQGDITNSVGHKAVARIRACVQIRKRLIIIKFNIIVLRVSGRLPETVPIKSINGSLDSDRNRCVADSPGKLF